MLLWSVEKSSPDRAQQRFPCGGVVISHSSEVEIFPVLQLPLGHPDFDPGDGRGLGGGGRLGLPGEGVLLEVQGLQFGRGRGGRELDIQIWKKEKMTITVTSVPLEIPSRTFHYCEHWFVCKFVRQCHRGVQVIRFYT